VEYALVIGLVAEPVLIPGPVVMVLVVLVILWLVGMALVVVVVIWEPVGMALVVVIRTCGDSCRGVGDGRSTSRCDDRGGGDI
jgi:hypothetical protein